MFSVSAGSAGTMKGPWSHSSSPTLPSRVAAHKHLLVRAGSSTPSTSFALKPWIATGNLLKTKPHRHRLPALPEVTKYNVIPSHRYSQRRQTVSSFYFNCLGTPVSPASRNSPVQPEEHGPRKGSPACGRKKQRCLQGLPSQCFLHHKSLSLLLVFRKPLCSGWFF